MSSYDDRPEGRAVAGTKIRAEIFCGANIGSTGIVSDLEFETFLTQHCRFEGYTVINAVGHWTDPDPAKWSGKEWTRVIVIYGPNSNTFAAEVRKLAAAYARQFNQSAVGVGFSPAGFFLIDQSEGAPVGI